MTVLVGVVLDGRKNSQDVPLLYRTWLSCCGRLWEKVARWDGVLHIAIEGYVECELREPAMETETAEGFRGESGKSRKQMSCCFRGAGR